MVVGYVLSLDRVTIQAHRPKTTQDSQKAPVISSTLHHAEGGAIQDAITDLSQTKLAPTEVEQAQEVPADIPSTLLNPSASATHINLSVPVAPVLASQSDIGNTSGRSSVLTRFISGSVCSSATALECLLLPRRVTCSLVLRVSILEGLA